MKKHDWKSSCGFAYRCKECGCSDNLGADPLDSTGIVAEIERMTSRQDCPGRPKPREDRVVAVKTTYSREDLMMVIEDHGGYVVEQCVLCRRSGWAGEIQHGLNCVLRDKTVKGVKMEVVT